MKKILIAVVVVIVLIALAGMYKFNYLASQEGYDADGNKIEAVQ
jgi:flagellar basal body-associated protein FliL